MPHPAARQTSKARGCRAAEALGAPGGHHTAMEHRSADGDRDAHRLRGRSMHPAWVLTGTGTGTRGRADDRGRTRTRSRTRPRSAVPPALRCTGTGPGTRTGNGTETETAAAQTPRSIPKAAHRRTRVPGQPPRPAGGARRSPWGAARRADDAFRGLHPRPTARGPPPEVPRDRTRGPPPGPPPRLGLPAGRCLAAPPALRCTRTGTATRTGSGAGTAAARSIQRWRLRRPEQGRARTPAHARRPGRSEGRRYADRPASAP